MIPAIQFTEETYRKPLCRFLINNYEVFVALYEIGSKYFINFFIVHRFLIPNDKEMRTVYTDFFIEA